MVPTRLFTSILVMCLTAASPLSAMTLEDLDRQYRSSETREALLQLESLLLESAEFSAQADENAWRLARIYYALGNRAEGETKKIYYGRCVEQADRTIRINGKSAYGYFFRGLCLGKQGEMRGIWSSLGIIDPLQRDMETAIGLDPSVDSGGPHRALGMLYLELPFFLGGSLEKSIHHLKEAVRLGPRYAENHLDLAKAYYENGHYDDARASLITLQKLTGEGGGDESTRKIRAEAIELMEKIKEQTDS